MSSTPWRISSSAISGPRPLAGTGSNSGPRFIYCGKAVPAFRERFLVIGIGAIDQRGRRFQSRRVVGIERGFRRIIAGVKKAVADAEVQPDTARRVPVAAGGNGDAEHVGLAGDRQRPRGNGLGQTARDDLGRIDRRMAECRQERQAADMVFVAVAQNQRIDRADSGDVRQRARRRPFAEVEHEPLAGRFQKETGRPLFADARYQPQAARTHHSFYSPLDPMPDIDNRKPRP